MPTNTRTPYIPPDAGGGSTSNVCSISPSDTAGNIDSLTARVKALEDIVSQMMGRNVTANQLSELSQQVGWVYGITYMGQPGWIQTEAGTLIPPKGWSLSSLGLLDYAGNPYQAMAFDSDGNIQWAVDSDANVTGTSTVNPVTANMLVLQFSQSMTTFNEYLDFDSQRYSGGGITWSGNAINVTAGTYLISVYMSLTWGASPTDDNFWEVNVFHTVDVPPLICFVAPFDNTSTSDCRTVLLRVTAGDTIKLRYKNNDDVSVSGWLSIAKLSG